MCIVKFLLAFSKSSYSFKRRKLKENACRYNDKKRECHTDTDTVIKPSVIQNSTNLIKL